MAKRRSSSGHRTGTHKPLPVEQQPQERWRQVLLLVSVVPMLAGIVLFAASWFGGVWIGNATTQTVTGAVLAFLGFTLSNLLQRKWLLAGGWALLGVAVWLLIAPPVLALRWLGALAGVAGMVLVLLAFVARYRQIRPTA